MRWHVQKICGKKAVWTQMLNWEKGQNINEY
jgi:hypothetical protein